MKNIIPPIRLNDQGKQVQNLHFTLFLCLQKSNNPKLFSLLEAQQFTEIFKNEAHDQVYGVMTSSIVESFQENPEIPVGNMPVPASGEIDKPTAEMFNKLLLQYRGLEMAVPPNYPFDTADPPFPPPTDPIPNNPPTGKEYKVSGKVFNTLNEPLSGQQVVSYDLDLIGVGYYKKIESVNGQWFGDGMQKLGEATSDANGYYEINFHESDFADAEGDTFPDIVSFVTSNGFVAGKSALSTRKDFTDGTILDNRNIIISNQNIRGESEYAKLRKMVDPFMEKSKLALFQIAGSEDQIQFVAAETEQDVFNVRQLVLSDALTEQAPELNQFTEIDRTSELLYGLGRQNLKLSFTDLSKTSIVTITASIQQSHNDNIISLPDPREVEDFARGLHDFSVQKNLDISSNQQNGIKNVLRIALKEDAVMQTFYKAYINRATTPLEFWNSLREDPNLKDAVDPLLLTNSLSALSGNNVRVMEKLAAKTSDNKITTLLTLSQQDWHDAIGTDIPDSIPGNTVEEKQNNYRESMQGLLNAAYPNEKVSLMVKSQQESGIDDEVVRNILNEFLTETKFDLRLNRLMDKPDTTSDDTFQTKLEAMGGDKSLEVINALNRIQRVFQFSPSPEVMTKLLQHGVDSATMVASMPYKTFKTVYADVADESVLLGIHQRASHIVSMIEYSILSLNRFSQSAKIPGITGELNSSLIKN